MLYDIIWFSINTIHLQNGKLYKTRKPKLRIEILANLVLKGKLSKGMMESILKGRSHADIINAFNKLEERELVKKSGYVPFARGRKQYYYEITRMGLQLLIIYEPHPLKFWKIILGYCHHYNVDLTSDNIYELYNTFLERYLKYRNCGFSFQLDIFDNMCDQWFREIILRTDKPNLEQKIIEVLAIYPRISFEELVKKVHERKSNVSKCLSTYTIDSYRPLTDNTVYIYQNVIGNRYNKKYWDFLLHCAIITKYNSQDEIKTYELSLFGVMLVLTIVRSHDQGRLNHSLYYDEISFDDYYDKVAHNYEDKLPLVFGKWKLLKETLRLFSAYNFDVILDKDIRLRESDKFSVIRGGNKELYDSIREIILQTRQQLGNFANAGMVVWFNYLAATPYKYEGPDYNSKDYLMTNDIDVQDRPNPDKVRVIKRILDEVMILLNPIEYGFSGSNNLQTSVIKKMQIHLEQLFANEISAFYYFHLYFDYEFNTRFSTPMKYYSSFNDNIQFPISSSPKECLFRIIDNDRQKPLLREWISRWMQDISSLQKEIYEALKLKV